MKRIFLSGLLIVLAYAGSGQEQRVDSLHHLLSKAADRRDSFSLLVKILEQHLLLHSGKIDSSSAMQLLRIAKQEKNDSLLAISYNWIGSYLAFVKGDNTGGLEYYFKALPLAVAAADRRRISSLYFDMSLVYFRLQNYEAAGRSSRKGGENLPEPNSPMYPYMMLQFQRNMAQYYLDVHQLDSALHYTQLFETTSRLVQSTGFLYGAWYTYAQVYAEMGEVELAQLYFTRAEKWTDSISLGESKLRFYEVYIPFLLSQHKKKEAYAKALGLVAIANSEANDNIKLEGAGFMRQVYDSLGQYDSAYHYARIEATLNKRVFSQDNINKVQALAFTEQLRSMEEAAKKAEAAEQRRENIQYVTLALGIIVLVTLYLLLSRRFITSARLIEFFGVIALLIVFEFLNLLLHPFLERITHHSPLLMLIVLVAIAGILVPLHHRLEKWATRRLVEKNRQIRLAMARKTIAELEDTTS